MRDDPDPVLFWFCLIVVGIVLTLVIIHRLRYS